VDLQAKVEVRNRTFGMEPSKNVLDGCVEAPIMPKLSKSEPVGQMERILRIAKYVFACLFCDATPASIFYGAARAHKLPTGRRRWP
jgi:hypothetical protein